MKRSIRLAVLGVVSIACGELAAQEAVTLTFDRPETAGISGFRTMWDTPIVAAETGIVDKVSTDIGGGGILEGPTARWFPKGRQNGQQPGPLVFDAVHRSLLVRFPGCAESLAAELKGGYAVAKAELELPFINTELWPEGYNLPSGMSFLRDEWVRIPPNWHAVAWMLRKPWRTDPQLGPTYNATINGAVYWSRFGAQDTNADRYPSMFGPVEVSYRQATGYQGDQPPTPVTNAAGKAKSTPNTPVGGTPAHLDVTAALTNAAFGPTLAARLRQFADCGVLIRKEEVYDSRYHTGTYEWSTATGRRGILIRTPRLVVTLRPDPKAAKLGTLPPAADIPALAQKLKGTKNGGAPTATMPSEKEIAGYIERFGFRRPDGMPDWQWQRLLELKKLDSGGGFPTNVTGYVSWIDSLLATPPRQFLSHVTPQKAINAMRFRDALPEAVRENEFNYFNAWAMPWMRTEDMDHPQAIAMWYGGTNRHWEATHDWRGNQSYYRAGYTRRISTQNINHLGAAGALFGGALVGSDYAMEDGRYGLEHFPLRLWAWSDGTTLESIDHYYLPLTLWTQKEFADFGPTHLDRMMGQSMLAKTMDEVFSSYHPGLRRFIAPGGRTGLEAVLVTQTGLRYLMHSLSRSGALTDLNNTNTFSMPVLGDDNVSPGYVADEWLIGPWAPDWVANMVDEKPLPYELTAVVRQYPHTHRPEFQWLKCSYLGHHYGLTSRDTDLEDAYHMVQAMAQWRRADRPVETMSELGTMIVRPAADERCMDWYGSRQWTDTPPIGGINANIQYKNVLIALTSPVDMRKKVPPHSLQTALAFFNFQAHPTWEIAVDGQPVKQLPFKAASKQHITIRDGVSYVGIVPVPATDLGRDAEVVLSAGVKVEKGNTNFPGLTINNYMLKRDTPLDKTATDPASPGSAVASWDKVDRAYGGFVIEMGDGTEYPDFAAFQKHIAAASIEARWDEAAGVAHLRYVSGTNIIEAGYVPAWREGPTTNLFTYRRVNGAWPWPPPGIDRDTTLTQQGRSGRLEKNGAVLTCEPGRMAYLQTEPISGTVVGFNPLPDPTSWRLVLPGGIRTEPDGRVSMIRVEIQPGAKRLRVDYAAKEDQRSDDMASALLVFGMGHETAVTVNGAPLPGKPETVTIGNEKALAIPLDAGKAPARDLANRYAAALPQRDAAFARTGQTVGTLRAESDTYLFTVPRVNTWRFQRPWPTPSVIDARTPDGIRVTADGRVALLRLDVDRAAGVVDLDLPPCEQDIKEMKAKALLIFGLEKPPAVVINGKPCAVTPGKAELDDQTAFVFPLFGEPMATVLKNLSARYGEAQGKIRQ